MLHSTYHSKDTNEDPKTSSVFETMFTLPDELFWGVLRAACFDNENLPIVESARHRTDLFYKTQTQEVQINWNQQLRITESQNVKFM